MCPDCYEQLYFFVLPVSLKIEPLYLDKVVAATEYGDVSKSLIKTLKYSGVKEIALTCARLVYYTTVLPNVDCITSVPLHHKKQKIRGFNQSDLIAQELSFLTDVPYTPLLKKITHTVSQASSATKEARLGNLQSVFEILPTSSLAGKSILIVDDVITTGTTLNECAKVLKHHGAANVIGVCVAHGH